MKITKLLVMLKYLGERPRRSMVSKNEEVPIGIKSWLYCLKNMGHSVDRFLNFSTPSMIIKEYVV